MKETESKRASEQESVRERDRVRERDGVRRAVSLCSGGGGGYDVSPTITRPFPPTPHIPHHYASPNLSVSPPPPFNQIESLSEKGYQIKAVGPLTGQVEGDKSPAPGILSSRFFILLSNTRVYHAGLVIDPGDFSRCSTLCWKGTVSTDSHMSKTVCAASVKMRPAFSIPASSKRSTRRRWASCLSFLPGSGLRDPFPPSRGDAGSSRTSSLLVISLVRVGDPEEADDLELARLPSRETARARSLLVHCPRMRTGDVDEPDDLEPVLAQLSRRWRRKRRTGSSANPLTARSVRGQLVSEHALSALVATDPSAPNPLRSLECSRDGSLPPESTAKSVCWSSNHRLAVTVPSMRVNSSRKYASVTHMALIQLRL